MGVLCLMLILLASGLFFMPNMVSTDWFRHQFEDRASQMFHRPITVNDLQWTWEGGIRIKGVKAVDDPQYGKGPFLSVDEILLSVGFELGHKRLIVGLEMDGLKASLIRAKDGRTNLETWLDRLKTPRKPAEPPESGHDTPAAEASVTPFVLPVDLAAEIKLINAQLRVEDRMANRLLEIHDGTFKLDIPSLLSKPVNLRLSSRQSMDGKVLPPLALTVHADRLVDEAGALNPEAANLNIKGELPGFHVALKGSMAQKGLQGELKMVLAPLTEALSPFVPGGRIPRLSGEVLLQTTAQLLENKKIRFDLHLICKNILAAGGPLKERRVGPFSMTLNQKGSAEPADKVVRLESGEIRFLERSGLFFKGRIKMAEKNRANVTLALNKVVLHLDEIQGLAKGFMPHGIGWEPENDVQSPELRIGEAQLNGTFPDGTANLSMRDMALNLTNLHLAFSEDRMTVADLTLRVPHAVVQLKDRFPKDLEMRLNLNVKKVQISGKKPMLLNEGLTLRGHVRDVRITRMKPFRVDVGALEADIRSGDVLELHVQGAASDSGMKSFRSEGHLGLNLGQALKVVPAALNATGRVAGRVETKWRLKGRRPTDREIAGLTDKTLTLLKRMQHGHFLEKLDLKTAFMDMAVTLPLNSGETLTAQGINTESPINLSTFNGLESVDILGKVKVDKIAILPTLKKLKSPLSADLSFNAVSRNLNSLELRETLHLAPLAVTQTLEMSLNKLKHLLGRTEKPDLSAFLKRVEAKIKAGITINTGTGLAPFAKALTIQGPLKGGLAVQLRGGKSVSMATHLESDGINAAVPPKFTVDNLKTHLQLEKTYTLAFGSPKPGNRKPTKALSLSMLQPEKPLRPKSALLDPFSQRLVEDLRGRFTGEPTLSFTKARLETRTFPVLLKNTQMQMRLSQSLPVIDYFQTDIMGGTLLGGLRILSHHDHYRFQMDGAFSGLDAKRLLQKGNVENPENETMMNEDTRISGRMSLQVPITANAGNVMDNLDAVFRLTHIGARTLERLFYAMDPHENNESIVQQRALLKKGTPRWIEVVIRNGSLSLTGEVTVAGSNLRLPAIKRLNMASLPIQKRIQSLVSRLLPLIKGLKILSANTLRVEKGGTIDFTEGGK